MPAAVGGGSEGDGIWPAHFPAPGKCRFQPPAPGHPHPPRSLAARSRAGPSHSVPHSQLGHLSALEACPSDLVRLLHAVRSRPERTQPPTRDALSGEAGLHRRLRRRVWTHRAGEKGRGEEGVGCKVASRGPKWLARGSSWAEMIQVQAPSSPWGDFVAHRLLSPSLLQGVDCSSVKNITANKWFRKGLHPPSHLQQNETPSVLRSKQPKENQMNHWSSS